MYTPKHFEMTDQAVLHDLMRRFSFAALVTQHHGRLIASHLPFVLEAGAGEQGTLLAHMAKGNEQWEDFAAGAEALVIFQGDHAYISPSWYETFPSVPTWNYMVVHAYGVPRIISDEARVRATLRDLVDFNEARFEQPWSMDGPEDYLSRMQRGIVAFEMPITRLEGKFKLSQNHPVGNRQRVVAALASSPDTSEQGVAAAMERRL